MLGQLLCKASKILHVHVASYVSLPGSKYINCYEILISQSSDFSFHQDSSVNIQPVICNVCLSYPWG